MLLAAAAVSLSLMTSGLVLDPETSVVETSPALTIAYQVPDPAPNPARTSTSVTRRAAPIAGD